MKVKLRNKAGQFCTLRELCSEEPYYRVYQITSPKRAAESLQREREDYLGMCRLAEIINRLGVPNQYGVRQSGIKLTPDGKYSIGMNTVEEELEKAKSYLRETERLAAIWEATSYEVQK